MENSRFNPDFSKCFTIKGDGHNELNCSDIEFDSGNFVMVIL